MNILPNNAFDTLGGPEHPPAVSSLRSAGCGHLLVILWNRGWKHLWLCWEGKVGGGYIASVFVH